MSPAASRAPQSKGAPLPAPERAALAQFIEVLGERVVLAAIGVNRQTFARAIAGLPVYPGSAALVRLGLGKLQTQTERRHAAEREARR